MDDYSENIGILFIILCITSLIVLMFIISYYNLYRFKDCYDNSFKFPYCEKYKNY